MNFKYKEIIHSDTAKNSGINNEVPYSLMDNMMRSVYGIQRVRELLGRPIVSNSWYRCPELNKLVKGEETSHHKECLAIDFVVSGMSPEEAFNKIKKSDIRFDQLILYRKKNFVHISFHPNLRGQLIEK